MSKNFQFSIFNFQNKPEAGFTLVETLVSLVILTVALIPVLNLSTGASKISTIVRDDMIASGLAQEGIEVVHAMRDTNWFNGRVFDFGIGNGNIGETTSYRIQWNSTALIGYGSNPPLKLSNGVYTYDAGEDTKFSRVITISKIGAGQLKIVSRVSWLSQTNTTKSIVAESHLFNWK